MKTSVAVLLIIVAICARSINCNAQTQAVETVLHSFGTLAGDGSSPQTPPVQAPDGNLYGTTDANTFYRITPAGQFTLLHTFGDGSVPNDGTDPVGPLVVGADGNLYGTTFTGGSAGYGTVYKMTTAGVETILHSFYDGTTEDDGADPFAGLTVGSDGNFYGTAKWGGSAGVGTIFRMTPDGVLRTSHSFRASIVKDAINPEGGLIQASDGSFYGATYEGGLYGVGAIYRFTLSGEYSVVYNDGVPSDKDSPQLTQTLTLGQDGYIYGTSGAGGSKGEGTLYRMSPANAATPFNLIVLHSFGDGTTINDGNYPFFGMCLASDGNFYGGTYKGGSANLGVLYRLTPSGVVTTMHSFGDGTVPDDGERMFVGPTQAQDGRIYGTTFYGGVKGEGTVFAMRLPNSPTILSFLPTSFDAGSPSEWLTVAGAGFVANTEIAFGTVLLPTKDIESNELLAAVPKYLLAEPGMALVRMKNPNSTTVSGKPFQIVVTSVGLGTVTLQRNTANKTILVSVGLKNVGYETAAALSLRVATLGSTASSSSLPVGLGNLASGATAPTGIVFSGAAGASGSRATLSLSGTFNGGTFFVTELVTLP